MPDRLPDLLLLTNLAATWFMTGLIWTIQRVHYPLFDGVGEDGWCDYHRRHVAGIMPVVGPVMLIELVTAWLLIVYPPAGVGRPLLTVAAVLAAALWASTVLIQIPRHARLAKACDPAAARALTAGNWLRTALWTTRAAIVAWVAWVAGVATSA